MGKYEEIRSNFVRQMIKGRSWNDRGYIDLLAAMERIVLQGGPRDAAEGIWIHAMQDEYGREYTEMLREFQQVGPPPLLAPPSGSEEQEWLELGGPT
jgi:hypothetical protein